MLNQKKVCCRVMSLAVALCAHGLFAQNATLTGVMTDSTGAIVPNATVTATQTDKALEFKTTTDAAGRYLFQNLPIGRYALQTDVAGFKIFRQTGIELTVDGRALVNIGLEVGATTEEVRVVGDAVRVDTDASTIQQLVDSRRVNELPLNGRNIYQLANLSAGVLPGFHISGGRAGGEGGTTINVRLDGALNVEQNFASILPAPPPDAVQEFTIQTSVPSAKYLYSAGVIEVATKSGTNELHGSLYNFFRNDALDARNFFAATVTKRRRNQYGGTVGGPVRLPRYDGRNRSFFFFGLEQQKEPLGAVRTIFVPTAEQRRGDFSGFGRVIRDPNTGQAFPGNIIPSGRLDPVAQKLLAEFVPGAQDPTGRLTYFGPADNNPTQVLVRSDHVQGSNLLTWRSYLTRRTGPQAFGNLPYFSEAGQSILKTNIHTFSWTKTLNPETVNLFRFSYNKWRTGTHSDFKIGTPDRLRSLGWSESFVNGVQAAGNFFPRLNVSGFFDVSTVLPYIVRGSDTFTWEDDLSLHRGRHNIQTGVRVMRTYQDDGDIIVRSMGVYDFGGQFTGSALTDFMLGRPSSFIQQNEQTASVRHTYFGLYLQDDIKVSRRLSVNVGVRYDLPLAPVESDGKAAVFLPGSAAQSTVFPNAPRGLLFVGDPGVSRAGRETPKMNFGPRVGMVYALAARTVLRIGYGILYNPTWTNQSAQFDNKQPWVNRIDLSTPPGIADPWAGFPGGNPFPSRSGQKEFVFTNATIFGFAPGYRDAYSQHWNLNLQREIAKDWLITMAYVATKGTHLGLQNDANPARFVPGVDQAGRPLSTAANLNARRPFYPPLTRVVWAFPGGNSSYHSMQASLDKRFGRGFSVLASYTFSKSIDLQSGNFDTNCLCPQNPDNFAAEKAPSEWDRTHAVVASGLWNLPALADRNPVTRGILGDWQLTGILTLYSGLPIGASTSIDNALRGLGNRPNRLRNAALSGDRPRGERIQQWFDKSAYAANGLGEFGSAPRLDGQLRGPGSAGFDLGVMKNFRFTERHRLQFRAEFFNALNRPNFGNPGSNFAASTFARITSAGDPRIIQFALKYTF